jgi:hypothetical protein
MRSQASRGDRQENGIKGDTMNCESCETVGIESKATTTRNGEKVCADCAAEIDQRQAEQKTIRETAYDERGIRK